MTKTVVPKLTGADTILCWLSRRIQPLKDRKGLMCHYTDQKKDPLRVSESDLTHDALMYRFKRIAKERIQLTEQRPMYTAANPAPKVRHLPLLF